MSRNYSNWWMLIIVPAWVFVSFAVAQLFVVGIIILLDLLNISLDSIDQTVQNTSVAALVYLITLTLVIGAPWLIKKRRVSLANIGLDRLPSWADILIAPAGLIVYLILSSLLMLLATNVLPWFDLNQVQDTGFNQLNERFELVLAFITLIIIAPVAEEIIFRGYLYGKLRKYVPIWVAILATSLLFGSVHGAWNLAFDTFALSVVLCSLRELTGSIWASILLHMTKNSIAFYILFINTSLLTTLGM
jgi:membrane protease YdiL (CAAX protease family)